MRSLRKIPTQLHGTNFCTTSARIAPSFVRQSNGHECTKIVRNAPKRQFRVQWGGLGAFLVTEFCKATKRSRMHPNSTKRFKTLVYDAMGWIGCVLCEKFRRDFVAQTFALLMPVLHRVSLIRTRLRCPNNFPNLSRYKSIKI